LFRTPSLVLLSRISTNYPNLPLADIQRLIAFAHSHRIQQVP
jgi:uncharacterized protein (DUF433 family)